MEMPQGNPNLHWLLERVQTPHFTEFVRATVPLLVSNGDAPTLLGSGVLFEIADHHFLISAAHVMDRVKELQRAGYQLFLPPGTGAPLVPLTRFLLLSSLPQGFGREDDPLDVCVAVLEPATVQGLLPHRRFLHLPDLDIFDQQRKESLYVVMGYPTERVLTEEEGRITYEPLLYGTRISRRDLGDIHPPRNPAFDYVLDFSREFCARLDGLPGQPADPGGISGCGIWRLIMDEAKTDQWSTNEVKLVAIEHGWRHNKHFIRGTRVGVLVSVILNKYPELQAAAQISYPFL
jgi:hypothetical protein